MENQSIRREKTKPLFFSARSREMIIERIRSGEFKTHREVMETFGVGYSTVTYWKKKAGFKFPGRWREIEDVLPNEKAEEMKQKAEDKLKEKWEDHPFVEPDPGVESFKTEKDALEYYKLRAEYLENLYMLADSPTEVKKKALRQLDERIRQKMAKGETLG